MSRPFLLICVFSVGQGTQLQGPVSQATPGVSHVFLCVCMVAKRYDGYEYENIYLQVTTPLNMDAPANSPGNTDHGFMKKLKEFDGLAMSISNNKVGSAEHSSSEHRSSQRFVKL